MKVVAVIVIVAFMFADAFLMWCLLRANALYEQNENKEKESLLGRLKEKQQFLIANARKEDKEKRAERDLT